MSEQTTKVNYSLIPGLNNSGIRRQATCSYVSEYFSANNSTKPKLHTPYPKSDLTVAKILPKIWPVVTHTQETKDTGITRLTPALAVAYLIAYAKEHLKFGLEQDWISYGKMIGPSGADVTPLDLVNLIAGDTPLSGADTTPDLNPLVYKWIAALLLAPNRICPITKETYKADQLKRGEAMLRSLGCKLPRLDNFCTYHSTFIHDPNYRTTVAMYDMFLMKGQNRVEDYQVLRFGTTTSHRKDCAILDSVDMISSVIGYETISELAEWIFIPKVAHEFFRVFGESPNEETDKPDSYLHYLSDFQLVSKSPYSAAINPSLHLFVHTIGCAMRLNWSKNAILVSLDHMMSIVLNGLIVAYQSRHKFNLRHAFILTRHRQENDEYWSQMERANKMMETERNVTERNVVAPSKPLSELKTSWEVFHWFKANEGKGIAELIGILKTKKAFLSDVRPNTIGELLKNL